MEEEIVFRGQAVTTPLCYMYETQREMFSEITLVLMITLQHPRSSALDLLCRTFAHTSAMDDSWLVPSPITISHLDSTKILRNDILYALSGLTPD